MSYQIIPEPIKDVSVSDLLEGPCVFSGWLRKQGKRNAIPGAKKLFAWSKRFIVLADGCMYSFADERSKSEKGSCSFYGYNSVYRAPDVPQSEALYAFKIMHSAQEYKTYVLSAASEPSMKEWMKQIKLQMMRANNKELLGGISSDASFTRPKARQQPTEDDDSDIEHDVYRGTNASVTARMSRAKLQDEDSEGDDDDSSGGEFYQELEVAHGKYAPPTFTPIKQPKSVAKSSESAKPPPKQGKRLPIPPVDDSSSGEDYQNEEMVLPTGKPAHVRAKNTLPASNQKATLAARYKPPSDADSDEDLYVSDDNAPSTFSPPVSARQPKTKPPLLNNSKAHGAVAQGYIKSPKSKTFPRQAPPSDSDDDQDLYIYDVQDQPPKSSTLPINNKPYVPGTGNRAFGGKIPAPKPKPVKTPVQHTSDDDQELYIYGDETATFPQTSKTNTMPSKKPPINVTGGRIHSPISPKSPKLRPPPDNITSRAPMPEPSSHHNGGHANRKPVPRPSTSSDKSTSSNLYPSDGSDSPPDSPAPLPPSHNKKMHVTQEKKVVKSIIDKALFVGDKDAAGVLINKLAEDGVFLIRQGDEGWVLVVYGNGATRKYKISYKDKKFYLTDSRQFDSIDNLIEHYSEHRLPIGICLTLPYRKHPSY